MIDLYKWLYKSQKILIKEIENVTKIRTFPSIITIGSAPDALGIFRPEGAIVKGQPIDRIVLNEKIFFESDNKHILKILGHEILHQVEKICDKLEHDHPRKFRKWESKLNLWIDQHTFKQMPEISFDHGSYFTKAKGISKFKTYQCKCNTVIYNMNELNIFCRKCESPFFLIDDGADEFADAKRLRTVPLVFAANKLSLATNKQIKKYSPFGLDIKLLEICKPSSSAPKVKKKVLDDREVKSLLRKLYQTSISFGALQDATIDNQQCGRIVHLLNKAKV